MSLRDDMQQNIQNELNFSPRPAGEACEAGREETESPPAMNDPESPASTSRLMEEVTSNRWDYLHWSTSDGVTSRTAVYGPVRTVVWQGSAGNCCPYADQTAFPATSRRRTAGPVNLHKNPTLWAVRLQAGDLRWYGRAPSGSRLLLA
jgi:hypothetical protein